MIRQQHLWKAAGFALTAAIAAWAADAGRADDERLDGDESARPAAREPLNADAPGRDAGPTRDSGDQAPFIRPANRLPRGEGFREEGPRRERLRALREEGPPGDPSAAESNPPLTPEEIEQFMAFTRDHFPEMYERLSRARREDGRAFRQMLRTAGSPMIRLLHLWRENPRLAEKLIGIQKLEMRMRMLRQRYRPGMPQEQQLAIQSELRRLLEQRFDLRIKRVEMEIAEMRKRLDQQTQRLADQNRSKERIIERELAQMLEPPAAGSRDSNRPDSRYQNAVIPPAPPSTPTPASVKPALPNAALPNPAVPGSP